MTFMAIRSLANGSIVFTTTSSENNSSLFLNSTNSTNSSTEPPEESDGDFGGGGCGKGLYYHSFMITLFVLGVTGNAVSVGIMSRRALRDRSFSLSLIVLATFNSLALLCEAITATDAIISDYYGSLEEHIGSIGCKLYRFLPAVIQLMDHCVVVFITTERFVAVYFPHHVNTIFSDRSSRIIFFVMFCVVTATQLWRPLLDTQEPAVYSNDTNGTLILEKPATCTANIDDLLTYVEIESFFHQLTLLFFLPALAILVMNTAVIAKLYHEDHIRATRLRRKFEFAFQQRLPFARHSMLYNKDKPSLVEPTVNATEQKIRKATLLLLTITCSFLVYITPTLTLLLYVRLTHLINGGLAAAYAFLGVCQPLNITNALATISYADNFFIQVIADEKFRLELKFIICRSLGRFLPPFQHLYMRERQKQRSRLASKYLGDSSLASALAARKRSVMALADSDLPAAARQPRTETITNLLKAVEQRCPLAPGETMMSLDCYSKSDNKASDSMEPSSSAATRESENDDSDQLLAMRPATPMRSVQLYVDEFNF